MKILISPDSYKESLTALEVAKSLKRGLKKSTLKCKVLTLPMADGGEGTTHSLVEATGGKIIYKIVADPLGRQIESYFGLLGDQKTAVVEMSAASGLPLLTEYEKNPELTTTYGTGELIKEALNLGSQKIIIGIGGSATNDFGIGMAQALGVSFKDKNGQEVGRGGKELSKIESIDMSGLDERVKEVEFVVACDVDNPLYGKEGAAWVYGPQKGATEKQVKELDRGLRKIARVVEKELGKKIEDIPGSGAAGGLGGGLLAFLEAELKPGIDIVIEASKLREVLSKDIDLVITGEGQLDSQSVYGKTPVGVAQEAKKYSLPVIAVCGTIEKGAQKVYEHGIDGYFSIVNQPMSLEKAKEKTSELLISFGENFGRTLAMFQNSSNAEHKDYEI